MSNVQENLADILRRAAQRLREAGLPNELAERMEELAKQVHQPCVVAVAGRVKVGKSTFVNALLRQDLAKVGTTETTATINYFSYGDPDPARPVRCHWRNGQVTEESREFLDSLQGNDLETLRRADGVDHLEYFLPNSLLKRITLVDTPGTGAVLEEHQDRTAEFMQLNNQLRNRHDRETRRLGDTADAVIYLIGQVAKSTDQAFVEEFKQTSGGRSSALNAIGVLSKIELQPEVLRRRHELSAKIASQLKDSLNIVIPVGAGVRRALDRLLENDRAGLERMVNTLRRIPSDTLEELLEDPEDFRDYDLPDSPVGPAERRELLGDMKWGVFATMARIARDPALDLDGVAEQLDHTSGFGPLWEVLTKHFVERGNILRCFRIAGDAQEVLTEIWYDHLPEYEKEIRRGKARLERFLRVINRSDGDHAAAEELEEFVRSHLDVDRRVEELETLYWELDRELDTLAFQLSEYNKDFEALQKLKDHPEYFSGHEVEELRRLLGLYGHELENRLRPGTANAEYIDWRQIYWKDKGWEAPSGSIIHTVAERASTRYGMLFEEIRRKVG